MLTTGSIAWNVNSVVFRPLRPASNLIVGVQVPKSKPRDEVTKPAKLPVIAFVTAPILFPTAGLAVEDAIAVSRTDDAVIDVSRVTVTNVVLAMQAASLLAIATAEVTTGSGALIELDEITTALPPDPDPDPDPEAGAAPTVPSTALVVRFANPFAAMTSATLRSVASNGVVKLEAAFAFSRMEPVTAGSMSGTTPRRARVVGSVGSEQMEGMDTTKGLKFCSAPARPRAAAMTWSSVPKVETIRSACVS